ncbi:MAG: GtrA family protein [Chitinivibrionales bacterium]|nr:GtrA family protein [Chitinivibrionales bacterium]
MSSRMIQRFIRFGIVGISGIFVNQGVLYCVTEFLKIDYKISSLIAIEIAILSNFALNSRWTWKDRQTGSIADTAVQLLKFNFSSIITAILFNWIILVVLTEYFSVQYMISNLIGIVIASAANFFLSNFWAFSPRKLN